MQQALLVKKTNCKFLVVGENYCFGRDRVGNLEILKKLGEERGINVNDDRARDEKRCVGMLFKTWNMGGNHFVWWN